MAGQPSMTLAGILFALGSTVLWSGNFVTAGVLAGRVPPCTLAAMRWILASVILVVLCRKELVGLWPGVRKHWRFYLAAALTGVTLFSCIPYTAARSTSVMNMSLMATTSPIFTLLLARLFLKEPLAPLKVAGIALAFTGVVLLIVRGDLSVLLALDFRFGDLLVLTGSFIFAIYTIQLRAQPLSVGPLPFTAIIGVLGALALLPLSAAELLFTSETIELNGPVLSALFYVAVGPSVIAYWCWSNAVALMGAGNTMLVYYLMPLFCGIGGVLLLDEPLRFIHLISGLMILGGILAATRAK